MAKNEKIWDITKDIMKSTYEDFGDFTNRDASLMSNKTKDLLSNEESKKELLTGLQKNKEFEIKLKNKIFHIK